MAVFVDLHLQALAFGLVERVAPFLFQPGSQILEAWGEVEPDRLVSGDVGLSAKAGGGEHVSGGGGLGQLRHKPASPTDPARECRIERLKKAPPVLQPARPVEPDRTAIEGQQVDRLAGQADLLDLEQPGLLALHPDKPPLRTHLLRCPHGPRIGKGLQDRQATDPRQAILPIGDAERVPVDRTGHGVGSEFDCRNTCFCKVRDY